MAVDRSQQFSPAYMKSLTSNTRQVRASLSDLSDTNSQSSSSFFYNQPGVGLKSTQQLNVDWSRFENHTFFNSAEVNVNVAFDRVVNGFPFDGTRQEYEKFFENLTGFEKWVYDRFPKNVGYINFSGSLTSSISVKGMNGTTYPNLSSQKTAANVLDPGLKSFTLEMHLMVPQMATNTQVVCQKFAGTDASPFGFSVMSLATLSTTNCDLAFIVTSGSNVSCFTTASVAKGTFNHVSFEFNRSPRKNRAQIYINQNLVAESPEIYAMGDLGVASSPLTIGTGSAVTINQNGGLRKYIPTETLSGSIDEFRFWHTARTSEQLKHYARKSVYSSDDLALYFKFNEPAGTLMSGLSEASNGIVIDSSGNELHSTVTNFKYALRSTGSVASPMTYENLRFSPVLFPGFSDTLSLNTRLLVSASDYDTSNKNLITKLIPPHYLEDGKAFEGLDTSDGNIGTAYSAGTTPGTGKLGAAQLLSSFLYVWAKFFDEMKLYVDAFASVKHVDYAMPNSVPDSFLPTLLKWYGFSVPSFFNDASIDQFINAENIQEDFGTNEHALQFVQNQIHRRVLVNLLDIIRSKGTQHSVKSFIRALGIDPDNSFRIREFGGPTRQQLQHSRETKTEMHNVVDLRDAAGIFVSQFLSGSRTETGFPDPVGPMIIKSIYGPHGISSTPSDGLMTSGSFTLEGLFRFPVGKNKSVYASQSLMRMTTPVIPAVRAAAGINTSIDSEPGATVLNIVATSGTLNVDVPTVKAYFREGAGGTGDPMLMLAITGSNVFDGDKWNVSFGCVRNDAIGSAVSSSYFLRVAKQLEGDIEEFYTTSSFFQDIGVGGSPGALVTRTVHSQFNPTGLQIVVGNGPITSVGFASGFLNDATVAPPESRVSTLQGQFSQLRFWSKALNESEWFEHIRNPKSIGVAAPSTNFNFVHSATGSFGRLRMDVSADQLATTADAYGGLILQDFSQNGLSMSGSSLTAASTIIRPDMFRYSMISPAFDEAVTNDKIRARSFMNLNNVRVSSVAQVAPVYEPEPSEPPADDTRFSIEFSLIDALNRDIINIFGALDEMDNALGNPDVLFSVDYPGLDNLRNVYFNRLTGKMNFRAFFEYFKWFDSSISTFIEQLIPRKTKFYGTNFVIESHMLERAKMRYNSYDSYLGAQDRIKQPRDTLLQFLEGSIRKF